MAYDISVQTISQHLCEISKKQCTRFLNEPVGSPINDNMLFFATEYASSSILVLIFAFISTVEIRHQNFAPRLVQFETFLRFVFCATLCRCLDFNFLHR